MDHTEGNYLGYNHEAGGLFMEDPMTPLMWKDKMYANTCIPVQNLILNKDLREAFNAELGVEVAPAASQLFMLFNGTEFSDILEVSYSDRFMNNEVGPKLGFITGVGLKVPDDINDSVPQLRKLKEMLKLMNYRGEVAIGLSERFTVTGVHFGHLYGHWALFSEICKNSVQDMLDFIFGTFPKIELHDSLAIGNVVSQPPFPNVIDNVNGSIHAPKDAEKHLWRVILGGSLEIALVAIHGTYLGEARKRIRRTLNNMLRYSDTLQYRTDYGYNATFVVCKGKYDHYSKSPFEKKA
jgi:hypothetical protein